jgi:prepilin-type N-terminal cleavage/methylation domain-containing protein
MPRVTPSRPLRGDARGFTLVELLVVVIVLTIVGGSLGGVLVSQYRIFNRTRGATQMQRDLRTGLGLLPLDLRGASRAAGDFLLLSDTAIALRATIGSSVVCARPGVRLISLPPRNGARADLTQWHTAPMPGDQVLVYDENTRTGPDDDLWRPYTIVRIDSTSDCAGPPFTDAALDPTSTKKRFRVQVDADLPLTIVAGMPVRFLRQTRYSLYRAGASADADDWYLGYRELVGGVWTPIEPIAGPFEAPNGTRRGIRFTYFDTLGAALASPTATTVGRVDLAFRSRNKLRGAVGRDSLVLRDSLSVRVALRNRL